MNSYAHFELDKNYIEQPMIFLKSIHSRFKITLVN